MILNHLCPFSVKTTRGCVNSILIATHMIAEALPWFSRTVLSVRITKIEISFKLVNSLEFILILTLKLTYIKLKSRLLFILYFLLINLIKKKGISVSR